MNNKQIMYDCDKGYILNERGPVGATCVAGLWRPTELPACLPGLHPRLRWTRRKRGAKNSHSQKLLRNFSRFKREMREMLRKHRIEDPFPLQKARAKRSLIHQRGQRKIHRRPIRTHNVNHKWRLVAPAIMRFKRNTNYKRYPEMEYQFARVSRNDFQQQQRDRFEEEQQRAYNKYYQKIKQKHRKYINNLLRASNTQSVNDDEPMIFDNPENTYRSDDIYKTPAQDPFDEINAYSSMPIPLPNINQNKNVYAKKEIQEEHDGDVGLERHDGIVNNTFVGRNQGSTRNGRYHVSQEPSNEFFELAPKHHDRNVTDILELLRSQMIRRRKRILSAKRQHIGNFVLEEGEQFHRVKRSPRTPNLNLKKGDDSGVQQDEDGSESDNSKKSRPKEPCEVSRMHTSKDSESKISMKKNSLCPFSQLH